MKAFFSFLFILLTPISGHTESQNCNDYDKVISDLYTLIEKLNIKELKQTNRILREECPSNESDVHLLFSELTIADAENNKKQISSLRKKIESEKILDKQTEYFSSQLYVLVQSYFWDVDKEKGVELLNTHKTFYTDQVNKSVDVRNLTFLAASFQQVGADVESTKYFEMAEQRAEQIGDHELIAFVKFRQGSESLPRKTKDTQLDFDRKRTYWNALVNNMDLSVTRAEVQLVLGYFEVEGMEWGISTVQKAIEDLETLGVRRTALDGYMYLVELLFDNKQFDETERVIFKVRANYSDILESWHQTNFSDYLFQLNNSQQRFDEALKFKEEYYESVISENDQSKKQLDELLADYKFEEEKNKSKLLERSLTLAQLEKENDQQKIYNLVLLIGLMVVALVSIVLFLYRNQKSKSALFEMAMKDALTGSLNRRAILNHAVKQLELAHRTGLNLTIAIADLDNFKSINDMYGHAVGDLVLKAFAKLSTDNIRSIDYFGRWGGEEWLFILPGTKSDEANNLFQRISNEMKTLDFQGLTGVTFSMGAVDLSMSDENDLDQLIKLADDQLYVAKESGRNKVCFASEKPTMNH